jgi:tetratricopeptide (TPR) repeat protein
MRRYSLEIRLGLLLALMTAGVFAQLPTCEFVNFDDPVYVQDNDHVRTGLSRDNVLWAFTTTYASNWHPLTWLSLQADAQYYPGRLLSRGCHTTNLVWHVLNALLLFAVVRRMSGAVWRSFLVAALFAVHPLHVESVAWIAERKDVLSTFFWMLTLWTYASYAMRPSWWRYVLVVLAFALGLLAKPMLVTLPFVLLLLDYWPLGRLKSEIQDLSSETSWTAGVRISDFGLRVLEKLPLFGLSAASCVVTWYAQNEGGAIQSLTRVSLGSRIANAVAAYGGYLVDTIWPVNLAAFYPHPGASLPWWRVAGAGILLLAVTALALWQARRRPYLVVGWLWYLGTAVPVIGLVQVGAQAMADRYTYVPLIGVFIMAAWGLADLAAWRPTWRGAVALVPVLVVALCLSLTWRQASYWQNSVTLWEHAIEATEKNYLAHNNLGLALIRRDRSAAVDHLREALAIRPKLPGAHVNLAMLLVELGEIDEAMQHVSEALRLNPDMYEAHYNMGLFLEKKGRLDEAAEHYRRAIELFEGHVEAHNKLGRVLMKQDRPNEAVDYYGRALELQPTNAEYRYNWAAALYEAGRTREANAEFAEASRLSPNWPNDARQYAWKLATAKRSRAENAREALRVAKMANQATGCRCPEYLDTLAAAYAAAADFDHAVACARQAQALASGRPQLVQAIEARLQLYVASVISSHLCHFSTPMWQCGKHQPVE